MDQNQWFNTGSPAPMNDRQAFEAGWTAAQRQMAYTPQINQLNLGISQRNQTEDIVSQLKTTCGCNCN